MIKLQKDKTGGQKHISLCKVTHGIAIMSAALSLYAPVFINSVDYRAKRSSLFVLVFFFIIV